MGYALTIAVTMIATAAIVRFIERVKFTALVYYITEKKDTPNQQKKRWNGALALCRIKP